MLKLQNPSGKMARWAETLAELYLEIQYRPGRKHSHVDASPGGSGAEALLDGQSVDGAYPCTFEGSKECHIVCFVKQKTWVKLEARPLRLLGHILVKVVNAMDAVMKRNARTAPRYLKIMRNLLSYILKFVIFM